MADRNFWLEFGDVKIKEGFSSLNDAAQNLASVIATFWGWYTLVFTVGSSLKKIDANGLVIFLLVAPIPLLIVAYAYATWAQMPVVVQGDSRSWTDIRDAYSLSIGKKEKRLSVATIITFLAALSLAYALTQANFTEEKKEPKLDTVVIDVSKGDVPSVIVSGDLTDGAKVTIQLDSLNGEQWVSFKNASLNVTRNNHFDFSHAMPVIPVDLRVRVVWQEKDEEEEWKSLIKEF